MDALAMVLGNGLEYVTFEITSWLEVELPTLAVIVGLVIAITILFRLYRRFVA
jgi:hypothetical protein